MSRKRICFVTGTRAEFGLMRSALDAIRSHPKLTLRIVATGVHLDRTRGRTIDEIGRVDAIVPWPRGTSALDRAAATGSAITALARALDRLKSDIVLVVGDRVEAFAAAAAGAIGGKIVAHVHGGDRALGQLDDSLRHAVTKLAHLHFPATAQSAARLRRLGEERWRIHRVGSPGIDGILSAAAKFREAARLFPGLQPRRYALMALHPTDADPRIEQKRAADLLAAALACGVDRVVLIDPNNDPGAEGILRAWRRAPAGKCMRRASLPRPIFLALLRDAAMLIGNSSSGIIEAASFRTPVVDVGPRQLGRQRAADLLHVPYGRRAALDAAARIWNAGRPRRGRGHNPYQTDGHAGRRIARILGRTVINDKLLHKLIAY
jgi:GDP/UDP-N,N'-diacetylbacillosamine 2-epimerase (hydrolysing)